MRDHEGDIRGFYWFSQSWYARSGLQPGDGATDKITVGFYDSQGGTSGEFSFKWYPLKDRPTPRLEVFDDSWHAFAQMPDLIAALAEHDDMDISPATMAELLFTLGFTDFTERNDPDGYDREPLERRLREIAWADVPLDRLMRVISVLDERRDD